MQAVWVRHVKEQVRMETPAQVKLLLDLYRLETNGNGIEKTEAYRKIEEKLDPSLLKRYHRIRQRRGTGVAILERCMCSGCRIIYPETHEFMRYKSAVHQCEFCGRLLVEPN